MKKLTISLFLWVFSLVAYSQQSISADELPASIFGDFNNSAGNWAMDINKGFVIESRYLPFGYFKEITKDGDVFTFSVKAVNKSAEDYQFKLRTAGTDTVMIAVKQTDWQFMPYTHIPLSDIKYPDKEELLKDLKGKWYSTDGSDKLYVEFFDDYCMLEASKYVYSKAIIHGNTRQLNLSGEEFGLYFHLIESGKYPEYTRIQILGKKGWVNLKRSPELPNAPGILISDVPENLKKTMYATTAEDFTVKLLPGYQLQYNDEVIDLDRLNKHRNRYILNFTYKGRRLEYAVEEVNENYSRLYLPGNTFIYLKHDMHLPDGLVVENEFAGEWFACNGSKAQIRIEGNNIMPRKVKIAKGAFDKVLFDGRHYKFTKGNKTLAYLKKVNERYIEVSGSPEGKFIQYKNDNSLADAATVELPQELRENWINKENGQWLFGLMDRKVLYKNDVWNYREVSYNNGKYFVIAEKTDTVCYKNEAGKEVCRLFPKEAEFALRPVGANTLLASQDGGSEITCVNSQGLASYQPTFRIPEDTKAGYAVVKGFVRNLPDNQKNTRFEIIVNDLFYGDQVKYSRKPDQEGAFIIQVPLVTPQEVYMKYTGRLSTQFLIPGDTLLVYIDGSNTKNLSTCLYMGNVAEINRDWQHFSNDEYSAFNRSLNGKDRSNLALEPEEYKKARKELLSEESQFYSHKLASDNYSPGFKELIDTDVKVSYYEDLLRYCWLRKSYLEKPVLTEHPTYFSFLDSLNVTDKKNWVSGDFSWYAAGVTGYVNRKIGNNVNVVTDSLFWVEVLKADKEITETEKKNIHSLVWFTGDKKEKELMNFRTEVMNRNRDGIRAEIQKKKLQKVDSKEMIKILKEVDKTLSSETLAALYNFERRNEERGKVLSNVLQRNSALHMEIAEKAALDLRLQALDAIPYKEFFSGLVISSGFHQKLESNNPEGLEKSWHSVVAYNGMEGEVKNHLAIAYEKTLALYNKPLPEFAELNNLAEGSADEFLKELALKHQGKVLYIDFWAPWCGPCRSEFEHAPAMKEATKNKDVVYVYICGSGGKPEWENCIKKFNLEGDHYYLSGDTYSDLQGKFEITGIPRYMIMNRNGQMINTKASRPGNLPATLAELEKHLAE